MPLFARSSTCWSAGCAWPALPPRFGTSKSTAHLRFMIWSRAGVWGSARFSSAFQVDEAQLTGGGRSTAVGPATDAGADPATPLDEDRAIAARIGTRSGLRRRSRSPKRHRGGLHEHRQVHIVVDGHGAVQPRGQQSYGGPPGPVRRSLRADAVRTPATLPARGDEGTDRTEGPQPGPCCPGGQGPHTAHVVRGALRVRISRQERTRWRTLVS